MFVLWVNLGLNHAILQSILVPYSVHRAHFPCTEATQCGPGTSLTFTSAATASIPSSERALKDDSQPGPAASNSSLHYACYGPLPGIAEAALVGMLLLCRSDYRVLENFVLAGHLIIGYLTVLYNLVA